MLSRLVLGIVLFAGSAESASAYTMSTNDDTIIIMEETYDEFGWLMEVLSASYRVKYFNIEEFRAGGAQSDYTSSHLIAAIFEPNPEGIAWQLVYGMRNSDLHYAAINMSDEWEMMQAEVSSAGDYQREGASFLAYRRPGPDWVLHVDTQPHRVDNAIPEEMNVVNRTFRLAPTQGTILTTTLYKDDDRETIEADPMTIEEFAGFEAEMLDDGFRVTSVEIMQYTGALDIHVPWDEEGLQPLYRPILKRSPYLETTTQAWSLRRPQVIASLQSDELSSMTPQWIALAHFRGHNAVVGWHDYLPPIEHETYYLCGFRERAYWNVGSTTQHAKMPEKQVVPRTVVNENHPAIFGAK